MSDADVKSEPEVDWSADEQEAIVPLEAELPRQKSRGKRGGKRGQAQQANVEELLKSGAIQSSADLRPTQELHRWSQKGLLNLTRPDGTIEPLIVPKPTKRQHEENLATAAPNPESRRLRQKRRRYRRAQRRWNPDWVDGGEEEAPGWHQNPWYNTGPSLGAKRPKKEQNPSESDACVSNVSGESEGDLVDSGAESPDDEFTDDPDKEVIRISKALVSAEDDFPLFNALEFFEDKWWGRESECTPEEYQQFGLSVEKVEYLRARRRYIEEQAVEVADRRRKRRERFGNLTEAEKKEKREKRFSSDSQGAEAPGEKESSSSAPLDPGTEVKVEAAPVNTEAVHTPIEVNTPVDGSETEAAEEPVPSPVVPDLYPPPLPSPAAREFIGEVAADRIGPPKPLPDQRRPASAKGGSYYTTKAQASIACKEEEESKAKELHGPSFGQAPATPPVDRVAPVESSSSAPSGHAPVPPALAGFVPFEATKEELEEANRLSTRVWNKGGGLRGHDRRARERERNKVRAAREVAANREVQSDWLKGLLEKPLDSLPEGDEESDNGTESAEERPVRAKRVWKKVEVTVSETEGESEDLEVQEALLAEASRAKQAAASGSKATSASSSSWQPQLYPEEKRGQPGSSKQAPASGSAPPPPYKAHPEKSPLKRPAAQTVSESSSSAPGKVGLRTSDGRPGKFQLPTGNTRASEPKWREDPAEDKKIRQIVGGHRKPDVQAQKRFADLPESEKRKHPGHKDPDRPGVLSNRSLIYTSKGKKKLIIDEHQLFNAVLDHECAVVVGKGPLGENYLVHPRLLRPWSPQSLGDGWLRNLAIDIHNCFDGGKNSVEAIPLENKLAIRRVIETDFFCPYLLSYIGLRGELSRQRREGAEEIRWNLANWLGFDPVWVDGPEEEHIGIEICDQPKQQFRAGEVSRDIIKGESVHTTIEEGKAFAAYNWRTFVAVDDRADICEEYARCGILCYQVLAKGRRSEYFRLKTPGTYNLRHDPSPSFPEAIDKLLQDFRTGYLSTKAKAVWSDRIYH